jgi:sterol 3beta-glucosyltransferase
MRIVILAIGTLGDVQPYVALGIGFKKAGHSVCIASHKSFRQLVIERGLEFTAVGYPQQLMTGGDMLKLVDAGGNFISWMRQLSRLTGPIMEAFLNDCWQACHGAEAIIYSPFGWAGYHIAQKLMVPGYIASLQPISRSRYFPAVWSPTRLQLGDRYNLISHIAVEQAFWQIFRKATNRWRRQVLDLPPIPFTGPFGKPEWKRQPFLYGYSPSVIPKPADWPEWLHVTGYWFLGHDPNWQPPPQLVDFLNSGAPPVYIGFGSVPVPNQEDLIEMAVTALAYADQRGILQIGRTGDTNYQLSDEVFQAGWVPHDWLFPKMAALVHHGGASTTANGLLAGVPSTIIPFAWDQPFWGQRLARLGVSPPPIPRHKLTIGKLVSVIRSTTRDNEIAKRAATLGQKIRQEDGVAQAVEVFSKAL